MKIAQFVLPAIAVGLLTSSAQAAIVFHNTITTSGNLVINTITVDTDADLTAVAAATTLTSGFMNRVGPFQTSTGFAGFDDDNSVDSYVSINDAGKTDEIFPSFLSGGSNVGAPNEKIFSNAPLVGLNLTWFEETQLNDIGNGIHIARLVFSNTTNGGFSMVAAHAAFGGGVPVFSATGLTQIVNGAIVPEPASLALMGLGGLAVLRRR